MFSAFSSCRLKTNAFLEVELRLPPFGKMIERTEEAAPSWWGIDFVELQLTPSAPMLRSEELLPRQASFETLLTVRQCFIA
jgi:hypothetical protein